MCEQNKNKNEQIRKIRPFAICFFFLIRYITIIGSGVPFFASIIFLTRFA